jgi:hypothetical protein
MQSTGRIGVQALNMYILVEPGMNQRAEPFGRLDRDTDKPFTGKRCGTTLGRLASGTIGD